MTERRPTPARGWQCPWCPHQVITVGSTERLAELAHAQAIREHTDTHLDGAR